MASYKKVTVVGAGAMGGGIAQVLARPHPWMSYSSTLSRNLWKTD